MLRYDRQTKSGLVALYDIRPGNGAGPFLQPRSPHGAFKGPAQDAARAHKIDQLKRALGRLSLVHSHDALVLLKNSLSMPKLLYILRTADCSDNPPLATFDNILRSGPSSILTVDLSDTQWLQASPPVRHGGLGIRSVQMLAPSAFLASAASTHDLQQSILPESVGSLDDESLPAVRPGAPPCPTAKNQISTDPKSMGQIGS